MGTIATIGLFLKFIMNIWALFKKLDNPEKFMKESAKVVKDLKNAKTKTQKVNSARRMARLIGKL